MRVKNAKKDAHLAIYQYGGGSDESYIEANKHGLALFASKILKAALESDKKAIDDDSNIISFDYDEEWLSGETIIQYVEFANKDKIESPPDNIRFIDRLIPIGCILVLLFIAIATIMGCISIFNWFF